MKKLTRCLSLFCAAALCAAVIPLANAVDGDKPVISFQESGVPAETATIEEDYADMINHWAKESVRQITKKKLMDGMTATTFEPDKPVTRATLVEALYRLAGSPESSGPSQFSDIRQDAPSFLAVVWATDADIIQGNDGKFRPDDPLTREELATILFRFTYQQGYDIRASNALTGFSDLDQVSDWAQKGVNWALDKKLLSGVGDNRLAPGGTATRAQLAVILQRYLKAMETFNPKPDAEIIPVPSAPTAKE